MTEHRNRWLCALFALCIARLWFIPLPSSFWVDELVTAFVIRHPGHASFAVAPQVPLSIYYWLPRMMAAMFGISEIAFRIPSIIAMLMALWFIAKLAARLIHPNAGWFAVFAALSIHGMDYFAIDARPYGLGIMAASGCLYFLVRWLDDAKWPDAIGFVFFGGLVWWVHLMNWPFYLAILIYALTRLKRMPMMQVTVVAFALLAALVPQALKALQLAHNAQTHVFVAPPSLHEFEHELHWNIPLLCGLAMWLWAKREGWVRSPISPGAWVLILGWWLCQPTVIFAYSHLTGNSVYVGRYLSVMLPGVALATAGVVAWWIPENRWPMAALLMGIAALATQGHLGSLLYRHDNSDWRSAAREVNRFAPNASVPVITPSPFVEARPPAWSPQYPLPGFLYAHLDGYPITGKPLLFPFDSPVETPDGVRYATSLVGELVSEHKFAIYGPLRHVRDWRIWFSQRPEFSGWTNTLQEFGDVYVAEFTEGTSSTTQR